MHLTFGELGNDWIFSIYGYYCLGGVYLFNGITGLVMNPIFYMGPPTWLVYAFVIGITVGIVTETYRYKQKVKHERVEQSREVKKEGN